MFFYTQKIIFKYAQIMWVGSGSRSRKPKPDHSSDPNTGTGTLNLVWIRNFSSIWTWIRIQAIYPFHLCGFGPVFRIRIRIHIVSEYGYNLDFRSGSTTQKPTFRKIRRIQNIANQSIKYFRPNPALQQIRFIFTAPDLTLLNSRLLATYTDHFRYTY